MACPSGTCSLPPTGYMPNSRLKSREAELAVRLKIFKLKFQGYLEKGYTAILVPRFAVTKVSLNNVITDIQVV